MKKIIPVATAALLSATMLCGCNKGAVSVTPKTTPQSDNSQVTRQTETDENPEQNKKIEITIDGNDVDGFFGVIRKKSSLPGARRHFTRGRYGHYEVEYIHTPYGIDKDSSLDYKLTLNKDNTFELTVVSDGVTAEHSGRWYERRNEIMMYYDEQIDPPAHNVYVADTLFGDLLPQGKIMIYDKCCTIVLARSPETQPETPTPAQ